MSNVQESACGCCGTPAESPEPRAGAGPATRTTFVAGAQRLGITGTELTELVATFDRGNCPATRASMARLIQARLAAAQERSVALTGRAAATKAAYGGDRSGPPQPVADLTDDIVTALAAVARLQSAAASLAEPSTPGACDDGCACVTAASAQTAARVPTTRMPMSAAALDDGTRPDLVCTFDGGPEAMHERIRQWRAVVDKAVGREPADGGVTLTYDHDPAVTVELARLAAVEFACCSFFTFTLAVAPGGMRFTMSAPDEARDAVTALLGTADPAPVGGSR
jgi:hypothetical protein